MSESKLKNTLFEFLAHTYRLQQLPNAKFKSIPGSFIQFQPSLSQEVNQSRTLNQAKINDPSYIMYNPYGITAYHMMSTHKKKG
jgi:hypothetical protein